MPGESDIVVTSRFLYKDDVNGGEPKSVEAKGTGAEWSRNGLPDSSEMPVQEAVGNIFSESHGSRELRGKKLETLDEIEATISLHAEKHSSVILAPADKMLTDYIKTNTLKQYVVMKTKQNTVASQQARVVKVSGTERPDGNVLSITFHFDNGAVETHGFNPDSTLISKKGAHLDFDEKINIVEICGQGAGGGIGFSITFVTTKGTRISFGTPGTFTPNCYKAKNGFMITGLKLRAKKIIGIVEVPSGGSKDSERKRTKMSTNPEMEKRYLKKYTDLKRNKQSTWLREFNQKPEVGSCAFCFAPELSKKEQYIEDDLGLKNMEKKILSSTGDKDWDTFSKELLKVTMREDFRDEKQKLKLSFFDAPLGTVAADGKVTISPKLRSAPTSVWAAICVSSMAYHYRRYELKALLQQIFYVLAASKMNFGSVPDLQGRAVIPSGDYKEDKFKSLGKMDASNKLKVESSMFGFACDTLRKLVAHIDFAAGQSSFSVPATFTLSEFRASVDVLVKMLSIFNEGAGVGERIIQRSIYTLFVIFSKIDMYLPEKGTFSIDTEVRVHGLKNAKHLNGKLGNVSGPPVASTGRIPIRGMWKGTQRTVVNFKPENITATSAARSENYKILSVENENSLVTLKRLLEAYYTNEGKETKTSGGLPRDIAEGLSYLTVELSNKEIENKEIDSASYYFEELDRMISLGPTSSVASMTYSRYMTELERSIPDILDPEGNSSTNTRVTVGALLKLPQGEAQTSHCQINNRRVNALRGNPVVFADQASLGMGRWYYEVHVLRNVDVRVGWYSLRGGTAKVNLDAIPGLGSDSQGYGLDSEFNLWHDGKKVLGQERKNRRSSSSEHPTLGCEILFERWDQNRKQHKMHMDFYYDGELVLHRVVSMGDFDSVVPAVSCGAGGSVRFAFSLSDLKKIEYMKVGYCQTIHDPRSLKSRKQQMEEKKRGGVLAMAGSQSKFWRNQIFTIGLYTWRQLVPLAEKPTFLPMDMRETKLLESVEKASQEFTLKYICSSVALLKPILNRSVAYGVDKIEGRDAEKFEGFFELCEQILKLATSFCKALSKVSSTRSSTMLQRLESKSAMSLPLFKVLKVLISGMNSLTPGLIVLPSVALRILPHFISLDNAYLKIFDGKGKAKSHQLPLLITNLCCTILNGIVAKQKHSFIEIKNKWWLESGLLSGGIHISMTSRDTSYPDTPRGGSEDVKQLKDADVKLRGITTEDIKLKAASQNAAVSVWSWCPELCEEFVDLSTKLESWQYTLPPRKIPQDWESSFLGDVFHKRGKAAKLIKLIQKKRRMKMVRNQHGGKATENAVCAVLAVMLHHCHLVPMAEEASTTPPKGGKPPQPLMTLWTQAFNIALICQRLRNDDQDTIKNYGSLKTYLAKVIKRCRFLLLVDPAISTNSGGEGSSAGSSLETILSTTPLSRLSSLKEPEYDQAVVNIMNPKQVTKLKPNSKWRKVKAIFKLRAAGQVTRRLRDMVSLRKRLMKQKIDAAYTLAGRVVEFINTKGERDLGRELCECLVRQRIRATYRIAALVLVRELGSILSQYSLAGGGAGPGDELLLFAAQFARMFTPGSVRALQLHSRGGPNVIVRDRAAPKPQPVEVLTLIGAVPIHTRCYVRRLVNAKQLNGRLGRIKTHGFANGRQKLKYSHHHGEANFKRENLLEHKYTMKSMWIKCRATGYYGHIISNSMSNFRVQIQVEGPKLKGSKRYVTLDDLLPLKSPPVVPKNFKKIQEAKARKSLALLNVNPFVNTSKLLIGDRVVVQGLIKSKRFNGRQGEITGYMLASGRYPVKGDWDGNNTETLKNFKPSNLMLVSKTNTFVGKTGDSEKGTPTARLTHYLMNLKCCGSEDSKVLSFLYYDVISSLLRNKKATAEPKFWLQLTGSLNLNYGELDASGLVKTAIVDHLHKKLPYYSLFQRGRETSFNVSASAWNMFRLITYFSFLSKKEAAKEGSVEFNNVTGDNETDMYILRNSVMDIIFSQIRAMFNAFNFAPRTSGALPAKFFEVVGSTSEQSLADAPICWFDLQCTRGKSRSTPSRNDIKMYLLAAVNQYLWILLRCATKEEGQRELSQKCWISLLSRVFYTTSEHHGYGKEVIQLVQLAQQLVARIFRKVLKLTPISPALLQQSSAAEFHSMSTLSNDLEYMFYRIGVFSLPLPFTRLAHNSRGGVTKKLNTPLKTWESVVSHRKLLDLRRDLESSQASSSVVEDLTYIFRSLLAPITVCIEMMGRFHQQQVSVQAYLGDTVWGLKVKTAEMVEADPSGLTLMFGFKPLKSGVLSDFRLYDGCIVRAKIEDTKENKQLAAQGSLTSDTWKSRVEDLIIYGLREIKPTIEQLETTAEILVKNQTDDTKAARALELRLERVYAALTVLGGTIYRIREGGKVKFKGVTGELEVGHISNMVHEGSLDLPMPDRVTLTITMDDGQLHANMPIGDVCALPDLELPFKFMKNKEEMMEILSFVLQLKCPRNLEKVQAGIVHFFSLQRRVLKIISELVDDDEFKEEFKKRNMMATLLKYADGTLTTESVAGLEHKSLLLESIPVPAPSESKLELSETHTEGDIIPPEIAAKHAEELSTILCMGFSRIKGYVALKACNWKIQAAMDYILAGKADEEEAKLSGKTTLTEDNFTGNDEDVKLFQCMSDNKGEIRGAISTNGFFSAVTELISKDRWTSKGFETVAGQANENPLSSDPRIHILNFPGEQMTFQDNKSADTKVAATADEDVPEGEDLFVEADSDINQRAYSIAALGRLSRKKYLKMRIGVERALAASYARRGATVFLSNLGMDDSSVLQSMINDGTIGALMSSLIKDGSGFEDFSAPFSNLLRKEAQNVATSNAAASPLTGTLSSYLVGSVLRMLNPIIKKKPVASLERQSLFMANWIKSMFVGVIAFVENMSGGWGSSASPARYYKRLFPPQLWDVMLELVHGTKGQARNEAMTLFSSLAKVTPAGFYVSLSQTKVKIFSDMMGRAYNKQCVGANKASKHASPYLQSMIDLNMNLVLLTDPSERKSSHPTWFKDLTLACEVMEVLSRSHPSGGQNQRRLPAAFLLKAIRDAKAFNKSAIEKTNNTKFTHASDSELVMLIDERDSHREVAAKRRDPFIDAKLLVGKPREKLLYTNLYAENITEAEKRDRYICLRYFNKIIKDVLPLVNLSLASNVSRLTDLVKSAKPFIFWGTKEQMWQAALNKTSHSSNTSATKCNISVFKAATVREQKKTDWEGTETMFAQLMRELERNKKNGEFYRIEPNNRAFTTIFKGCHSHDVGGPYRELFFKMAEEIQSSSLPLFIQCPNAREATGKNREMFVPKSMRGLYPKEKQMMIRMYEFLGQMMGLAIRTTNYMALNLPAIVWKPMVSEDVSLKDVIDIDSWVGKMMTLMAESTKNMDEKQFDTQMKTVKFEGCLADGKIVELIPGGRDISITWKTRHRYIETLTKLRTKEFDEHGKAMLRGLATVVPYQILSLFKWSDLRDQVCGKVEIDLKLLKSKTSVKGKGRNGKWYNNSSPHIKYFWQMMERMSNEERSQVIFFAWGRTRLPPNKGGFERNFELLACPKAYAGGRKPDDFLPIAHTCFFQLELPEYSSVDIMYKRMLTACAYCKEIDGDNDGAGRRAAAMT